MDEKLLVDLGPKWKELVQEGKVVHFQREQVLAYEGHVPFGLFVLRSGRVRFTQTGHREKHRCEGEMIHSTPEGDVIAFQHFIDEKPLCCTCTAESECELVFVSKSQMMPFIESPAKEQ